MEEEMFEEGEAMAKVTPPALARLTGSTGINPTQDSGIRQGIIALPAGVMYFLHVEYGVLTNDGILALESALAVGGLLLWGLFDKFLKGRLFSS